MAATHAASRFAEGLLTGRHAVVTVGGSGISGAISDTPAEWEPRDDHGPPHGNPRGSCSDPGEAPWYPN